MTRTPKTAIRSLVALLAAALAFAMLFSVLFVAVEARHDCHGDDCEICAQISACTSFLRKLSLTAVLSLAAALFFRAVSAAVCVAVRCTCPATLITLKVKLSD